MKIKKQVLAWGLAAGLAGGVGVAAHEPLPLDRHTEAGYFLAKAASQKFKLSEEKENIAQAGSQAAGAVIGAAAGAYLGAKIGLVFGIVGGVAGAAIGAI